MPDAKPPIPQILTRRDWDKKKGVFAKISGRTGIGEQCDALLKAYNKVKWERLDLAERKRVVLKNWSDESFTKANWDKLVNEAKAEVLGSLAAVQKEAFKLRDLCKQTETKFKASKAIPRSSTEHVKQVAVEADRFGIAVNKNTFGGILKAEDDKVKLFVNSAVIGDSRKACATLVAKYADLPDRWRNDPSPKNVNTSIRTDVRRFTQALGNMAKVGRRGWGPAVPAAQRLFEELTPYADPSTVVPTTASREESLAMLQKFEPIHNRAVALLRTDPLG